MMEYRQPVSRSQTVRFLAWRREGFVRRTIHRSPAGHPAARRSRVSPADSGVVPFSAAGEQPGTAVVSLAAC